MDSSGWVETAARAEEDHDYRQELAAVSVKSRRAIAMEPLQSIKVRAETERKAPEVDRTARKPGH